MAKAARALAVVTSALVLAGTGGAAAWLHRSLEGTLPAPGRVAAGVQVEGATIPTTADPDAFVRELADAVLDRPVDLMDGKERVARTTLRQLGAVADTERVVARALEIGRTGDWQTRVYDAMRSRDHGTSFSIPVHVPVEAVADLLGPWKEEHDKRPRGARRMLGKEPGVVPHEPGLYVDAYATAEAILRAARRGEPAVALGSYEWTPAATTEAARSADLSQVIGVFETRYGGPPGRDKNIARAAGAFQGVVLAPGDVVSFNELVGPRSEDNGFFPAPEIYKGEMREGIGGGSCQVASTLYAAAFFSGLEVLERRNHSRPSGYIRPGLDATVSYPVLDLRIKNTLAFPVVLAATMEPGRLRFEVLGKERPYSVELATETQGVLKYTRKVQRAALPEGEFRLKQKGKRGLLIKRKKTVTLVATGDKTIEESTDTYPAQQEIYLVGPKTDEGSLPPLEGPDAKGANIEGA
ncbi:MAG: VanW family protein [Myxococcales bacterium]|nr:VanW family protein [Myxococcales bacterium]